MPPTAQPNPSGSPEASSEGVPGPTTPPPGERTPAGAGLAPLRAAKHREWMQLALSQARLALATSDVPIGAVVVGPDGNILGFGRNEREASSDPTAHAEVVAIREAAKAMGSWRLEGCTLIVTLEPCAMCAGAIVLARIPTVVFGAWDEKAGAAGSVFDVLRERRLNHWVEVFPGVRQEEAAALLQDFFASHR
ncbi:tRNA adenosine(34) deaminase TadA [Paenarthrobacter sp. Z7-10]|uniref:tRNA adenosine(34) deaminase TadA n=1 Tax=Paenarthrobacter sp. Z7-10 TaxID=2787635 RepID=UPI0022A90B7B|nr:tRNA adenosine(34) deaminase TadA [Paenarthrobacter sp. Z7-10]